MTALSEDSHEKNKPGSNTSQEVLARFIDGSSIPAFVITRRHKVIQWNTAMEALSEIKKGEIQGTDGHWRAFYQQQRPTLADFIVDDAGNKQIEDFYGKRCKKSALIKGAYEAEDFFPEIGDKGKWLRITASPIKDDNNRILAAIETLEDITQRKIAEENMRYYLKAITTAQEEERKRIARELHDDTVQVLTSISRQLDTFIRKKRDLKPSESFELKDILTQLNSGIQDVHRFSQTLRLSVLDDLGLIPALKSLVKTVQDKFEITINLDVIGKVQKYPSEVETMLFRIVQEALNNIGKHSKATEALLTMEYSEEKIILTISDNGKGFDLAESIDALPRRGKLGLAGIKERASLLGGIVDVTSSSATGTCLNIEVPCGENLGIMENPASSDYEF